jgi:ribosomal protein S18 acetylase RimI-like enzyme
MFFVKYIATDKNHRNQHLATQLIREFEAEAISEAVDTNRPISISSRVNKQNIASQNRHLAN